MEQFINKSWVNHGNRIHDDAAAVNDDGVDAGGNCGCGDDDDDDGADGDDDDEAAVYGGVVDG